MGFSKFLACLTGNKQSSNVSNAAFSTSGNFSSGATAPSRLRRYPTNDKHARRVRRSCSLDKADSNAIEMIDMSERRRLEQTEASSTIVNISTGATAPSRLRRYPTNDKHARRVRRSCSLDKADSNAIEMMDMSERRRLEQTEEYKGTREHIGH